MTRGIVIKKILQMLPADGWWQVCRKGDGMVFEPLVCWVLIEYDYIKAPLAKRDFRQHITGLTSPQLAIEAIEIAQEMPDFLGYVHTRDFEDLGKTLKPDFVLRKNN